MQLVLTSPTRVEMRCYLCGEHIPELRTTPNNIVFLESLGFDDIYEGVGRLLENTVCPRCNGAIHLDRSKDINRECLL